jgi:hypothetical protein
MEAERGRGRALAGAGGSGPGATAGDVIALSDDQLAIVMGLARPLAPWQRGLYLETVARRLSGVEIGDGTVHAAAVAAQREVLSGPAARAG